MRLSAPEKGVWILSLIPGVISIVSYPGSIPVLTGTATYWVGIAAWGLLLLATYF